MLDEATLAMQAALAADEGIFVEPAGATTLAALKVLAAEGRIRREDRVVCLLMGQGLKDLGTARRLLGSIELIPLDRDAVAERLRRYVNGAFAAPPSTRLGAQLCELRPVAVAGPGQQPVLPRASSAVPIECCIHRSAGAWGTNTVRAGFRFFRDHHAYVEGHA